MTNTFCQRLILHVDMDAFFASVEQRDNPELMGKPVIVGGTKSRGVVSTASYEARPFGVHSAVPMARAIKLCPQAVVLPVRMNHYREVSRTIMRILAGFSPIVEPLSVDEAFLDMTGSQSLFGPPITMAKTIKKRIEDTTHLSCSVGIACNKFLAKLASDLDKPAGITMVPYGQEMEFIGPLSVKKLWGVGPKATARLKALGLHTIGQVAESDPIRLHKHFGSLGSHIYQLAHAQDDRNVTNDRDRKSIGYERTLEHDVSGFERIKSMVLTACRELAKDLRNNDLLAQSIRIKIRYSDNFQLTTRDTKLALACQDSATLFIYARELLDRVDLSRPIRLVGATAFDLQELNAPAQEDLFLSKDSKKNVKLERAMDAIRDKFGDKVKRGSQE